MAPQLSTSSTTQARNGRRSVAVVRRRALVAALGLAVLAAVVPVTAAQATPQSPEKDTHLTNPGGNPQPPTPPEPPQPPDPPDVPDWGPDDVANPTENPEPPLPPEPPDNGPDDLVNPTQDPEPPTPPVDNPTPSVDHSIPTPQRIDAGFGGAAAGSHQVAGVALLAGCLLVAGCQAPGGGPQPDGPASPARATAPVGNSWPVSILIPAIGVDARVVPVGLGPGRTMEVPAVDLAGWYEPGPRPGEPGPAVIVGHVDSRSGPAVFFRLGQLHRGDRIVVDRATGPARSFVVERVERQPKQALPTERIWNDADRPVLRLITCGGSFDRATGHYRDNVIVYASLARP